MAMWVQRPGCKWHLIERTYQHRHGSRAKTIAVSKCKRSFCLSWPKTIWYSNYFRPFVSKRCPKKDVCKQCMEVKHGKG